MKFLILIIILCSALPLYGAEPVVDVPLLPPEEKLEIYEDSEELFASKVMEYYNYALKLNTQLKMMGVEPYEGLFAPSFEELLDLDLEVIQKYYAIAKEIEALVILQPDIMPYTLINELKQDMRDTIIYYELEKNDLKNQLHTKTIEVIRERDSICGENLKSLEDEFFNDCRNANPLLAVSFFGTQFLFNDPIESKVSPGGRLSLNASSILGFGKQLYFYYEFIKPYFKSEITEEFELQNELIWNSQFQAVGANFGIGPLAGSKNYTDGIKLGFGYFWSTGSIYNRNTGSFSWEGAKMDIEYFGGIPNCRYPFEIFVRLSVLHSFSDNLVFVINDPLNQSFDMSDTRFGISFGLRYNFWRSSF